jgi:glycosyltransferase involved in cell wall biosynthesis
VVAAGKFRVSIFVLAYRMERTIVEAMDAALAQSEPCEIIVSDDASGDRTLELAEKRAATYIGVHKVTVRSNATNQGLCPHIDTLFHMATGDIFVFMAGDDVSNPDRVKKLLSVFDAHSDAYAVGSAVDEIDNHGNVLRRGAWFLQSPMDQRRLLHCGKFVTLLGASMAIRRELLQDLPPLQGMVEDNMLTLRASLFGRVYCMQESLLLYRRHERNLGSWVYARESDRKAARRKRYERTIRLYREIANDHARCLAALPNLTPETRSLGEQIVSMYRLEADSREIVLTRPKREWLSPIRRGLMHPGLRRKSFERALKLLIPRRWMGLR